VYGSTEDEDCAGAINVIAAAPDLLKALEQLEAVCHDYLTHEQQVNLYEELGWAREVIRRAKGK